MGMQNRNTHMHRVNLSLFHGRSIKYVWKLLDYFVLEYLYPASMKSYQYGNFVKYIIQLFGYCYVHVSGQRQADLVR